MPIRAGDALLIRDGPGKATFHLWAVLTDPDGDPPQVVMVMLVTEKPYSDTTVVLEPGDHPFIRHRTSVYYSSAKVFRTNRIERAIEQGWAVRRDAFTGELLAQLRDGLRSSPFTVQAIKKYCEGHW